MSINQYYPSDWWSYPIPNSAAAATTPLHLNHGTSAAAFCSQSTAFCYSHNNNENEEESPEETNSTASRAPELDQHEVVDEIPKEPLFEKSLTPSDVGKLNRLVIPKQHAEKYLPLNNGGGGGGDTGDKGLVLSFEDEVGKSWRFRYSYWNSSQSYVLTRGWSRFVKEKRLDAGDAVLFLRHPEDVGRLFIGWRRRNSGGGGGQDQINSVASANANVRPPPGGGGGGGGGWSRLVYNNTGHPYLISQYYQDYSSSLSYHYQPPNDCLHAADAGSVNVDEKQTTAASGNLKRVRLFGVNLDQWESSSSEPLSSPEGSSQARTHYHPYHD